MPSGLVEIEQNEKKIKFKGYVTSPASGVHPGVLLLHQGFGLDANIRAYAESLAANNYTVFVPDLFWRKYPGCELNSFMKEDVLKSKEILDEYDTDNGFNDITLCLKWLRETPQCNGLVASIGFGIGSNLSYLAGLWLDVESSVCYNFEGNNFFQENDTFIRRPMLIHLSKNVYNEICESEKNNFIENIQNIKIEHYSECTSNFYRIADNNYKKLYAENAFSKTLVHIEKAFEKPHTT